MHIELESVITSQFYGVGVQCSAYPWWNLSEEQWERTFQRIDFMRLPFTRVMQTAFYYWQGFDPQGSPIYDFNSSYETKLYRLLDWCETHHTTVIIGEWVLPQVSMASICRTMTRAGSN